METIRTTLIFAGLIGSIVTYALLVRRAFQRDTLWGLLALFCVPFGGWFHGVADHLLNRRILVLNILALGITAGAAFWFPRTPVVGYWNDESGDVVLRLDADGLIRNYGLEADGHYTFRGFKLATAELSVRSKTRLKIDGFPGFSYGYFNPETDVLEFFATNNDPELGLAADRSGPHHRLTRIPEPLTPDMRATLALLEDREAVASALGAFFATTETSTAQLSPSVLPRYAHHAEAARTYDRGTLARQPLPQVAEILRLRAMHGQALRLGANPADLFREDFERDVFQLRKLKRYAITNIQFYPGRRQALVSLQRRIDRDEYAFDQLTVEKTANGAWGVDADWHLLLGLPVYRDGESRPPLDEALEWVGTTFGLPVSKTWLEPTG